MFKSEFQPGSVEYVVERSIYYYPRLFENRTQVLHHYFIVIGTGVSWVDGRLDYEGDEDERDIVSNDGGLYDSLPSDIRAILLAELEERRQNLLQRRNNAAVLALTPGPIEYPYEPCISHAPYFTVPDDVRPEWLAARNEIGAVMEREWYNGRHYEAVASHMSDKLPHPSASSVPAFRSRSV